MAVLAEERALPDRRRGVPPADPAPLGLAAFALTTFILSGHNASLHPRHRLARARVLLRRARSAAGRDVGVPEPQRLRRHGVLDVRRLLDGARVLRRRSCSSRRRSRRPSTGTKLFNGLAWFLLAFAIFNTYMLLWSTRVNVAVFLVFLTLEITEILLASASSTSPTAGARGSCTPAAGPASSPPASPGTRRRPAS